MVIWITIRPWWRFALSECMEYDDCVWIFGGEGASPDIGWLTLQIVNPGDMKVMNYLVGDLRSLRALVKGQIQVNAIHIALVHLA